MGPDASHSFQVQTSSRPDWTWALMDVCSYDSHFFCMTQQQVPRLVVWSLIQVTLALATTECRSFEGGHCSSRSHARPKYLLQMIAIIWNLHLVGGFLPTLFRSGKPCRFSNSAIGQRIRLLSELDSVADLHTSLLTKRQLYIWL